MLPKSAHQSETFMMKIKNISYLTLHVAGVSTKSYERDRIAGSITNGTSKQNAKMLTRHKVPRNTDE